MREFLVPVILLALTACNRDKSTTVTTSDGQEIKITSDGDNSAKGGTISFEGKDGEGKITFGDAAAKQGLPLGLPVYPGGEVKGAFMGNGGKGESGGMATVMTHDAPEKVLAFYKAAVEQRGFEIKSQSTTTTEKGNMASFSAKAGKDGSVVVTATPAQDGGTAVVIIGGGKT